MNNKICKEQDKELIKHFLDRSFFEDWKKENDNKESKLFQSLELQLTSKCNLACKYCYYNDTNGFGKDLNNGKWKDIKENFYSLKRYLQKNDLYPDKIELFGGEVLNHYNTFEIIDELLEFYKGTEKKGIISIPSNMSFLRSDKKTQRVIDLKKKAKDCGSILGISASVDGLYMDKENRPMAGSSNNDKFYNDKFYHRLFSFSKNHGCGFHPMIYHNQIHKWKDNFLWFQNKFEEYGLPWSNIYLLEVRNDGWNKESINHYIDFYKFILNYVLHTKLNGDKEKFIKGFILNGIDGYEDINRMNMFNNTGTIGRGIGCSMQTTLFVRMGDLVVNTCHRLSYDMFNGFKFVKENDEIVDIEPLNTPFYFATISTNHKEWPYCSSCMIKNTCMSGCLGAQFETMGDPFIPIPSVCALEHGKVKAQIEFLEENNIFDDLTKYFNSDQKMTFKMFKDYKNGGKYE